MAEIGAGSGGVTGAIILSTPAYGVAGPNFIVRENVGYLSREEIILKQDVDDPVYPEGLVLKLAEGDEVMYEPYDGDGEAAGILYQMRNVSSGDTSAVAIVRAAEVQRAMLKFAGEQDDEAKEAAYSSLAAVMITMR